MTALLPSSSIALAFLTDCLLPAGLISHNIHAQTHVYWNLHSYAYLPYNVLFATRMHSLRIDVCPTLHRLFLKVAGPSEMQAAQSDSDDAPTSLQSTAIAAFPPLAEVPASPPLEQVRGRTGENLLPVCSLPLPARLSPCTAADLPADGACSIPLHQSHNRHSIPNCSIESVVPIMAACIDMCVAIMHMEIATTEACGGHVAHMRKVRRRLAEGSLEQSTNRLQEDGIDDVNMDHAHAKQICDLVAWHVSVQDARWYVKPRSTCWFEEYLFKIYTPDMFYDILRMRRSTFDRLMQNLRPFIHRQNTHWRKPIGVEKKMVVTLFKLMHGSSILLVADKAALGKSTVHDILRQVCSTISAKLRSKQILIAI